MAKMLRQLAEEEISRAAWVRYHLSRGEQAQAHRLGWRPDDDQQAARARMMERVRPGRQTCHTPIHMRPSRTLGSAALVLLRSQMPVQQQNGTARPELTDFTGGSPSAALHFGTTAATAALKLGAP
jgi:hypothetical protein